MESFDGYIRGWQERWRRQRSEEKLRALEARRTADQLAGVLAERFGASRVVLVGSLARGEFRSGSDIDLAVEGLKDDLFFKADAELARRAGDFGVDLIPIESATERFREAIVREGVLLRDATTGKTR
ncbi:MAG: nucleotidyltransferase domain-containing protein [Myxococcales bacterium]|nr:nucleotidyltransferase domain-containing protein [Myxococcales bacterium]